MHLFWKPQMTPQPVETMQIFNAIFVLKNGGKNIPYTA